MSWPLARLDSQEESEHSRYYGDEKKEAEVEVTSISSGGGDSTQIIGSSDMFDEHGNLRLIPVSALSPRC